MRTNVASSTTRAQPLHLMFQRLLYDIGGNLKRFGQRIVAHKSSDVDENGSSDEWWELFHSEIAHTVFLHHSRSIEPVEPDIVSLVTKLPVDIKDVAQSCAVRVSKDQWIGVSE